MSAGNAVAGTGFGAAGYSGTASVVEVRSVAEPIRTYNYQMVLTPPTAVGFPVQEISLRCAATRLPQKRTQAIPYSLSKFTIGVTGKVEYEHQWQTVLLEGMDMAVWAMLGTWHNMCFNALTGQGQYEAATKSVGTIFLLDTMDLVIMSRNIYGVFPMTFPEVELGSDTSALVNLPITWWFDWWDDNVGGTGGPGAAAQGGVGAPTIAGV